MSAQLVGYKDAQWTSAAFALMGEYFEFVLCVESALLTIAVIIAALLAALFLRSVGIVGHKRVIRHVDSDQTMAVQPSEPPTPTT